jgi:hypothetical protein
MAHCYIHTSPLLVMQLKTQKLVLQITPNITHKESLSLTLKVFNSHNQIFSHYEPSTAVCYRELTRKRASVSLTNPSSDTWETLLPTVLQLLRHCWCDHVTPPYSCIVQVFILVAWQQTRRGDAQLVTARQTSAQHGENTASSTAA